MKVEVVYALPERACVKCMELAPGASVAEALALTAIDSAFAGIDFSRAVVGIFGKLATRERLLEEGDRIEIYRPLQNDPKSARRERARTAVAGLSKSGRS